MGMNRLAYVYGIRPHFNRQYNHVARMRADHATAQDLAVLVGFDQPSDFAIYFYKQFDINEVA